MDKDKLKEAIKKLKETSKKRNFSQSFDLIVNLKDLNLKKPEEQIEQFIPLHYSKGKVSKICALVGAELIDDAKQSMDFAIHSDDFEKYKDKKAVKKLASEYDWFIAQATVMPKVAQVFGRVLGPRGKMPNPKAGCVVPPKAALAPLAEKLKKTIAARAKVAPIIQVTVGKEDQKEEEIIDNIITIYNALIHKLPKEQHNIKNVLLKMTMGKPVKLEL